MENVESKELVTLLTDFALAEWPVVDLRNGGVNDVGYFYFADPIDTMKVVVVLFDYVTVMQMNPGKRDPGEFIRAWHILLEQGLMIDDYNSKLAQQALGELIIHSTTHLRNEGNFSVRNRHLGVVACRIPGEADARLEIFAPLVPAEEMQFPLIVKSLASAATRCCHLYTSKFGAYNWLPVIADFIAEHPTPNIPSVRH